MEEDDGRKEEIITSTDDSVYVIRDTLKNIVQNAIEDEKKQADAGSKEGIKSAYAEGMNRGCEMPGTSLLS